MIFGDGTMEYIFTAGMLISFIGLIIGVFLERKNIIAVLKSVGFKRRDLLIAVAVVIVFVAVELYLVKPTQLLFFDDDIYQAMSLMLLHTGQAWMCNYGTPNQCFTGQVFHEPIGLSFNIAIAFAILGVHRSSAYAAEIALAAISVFMGFLVSFLMFKDRMSALFSSLILALTPVLLVWAMPTNSDMATLAYSLIALFMLIIFIKKRTKLALMNALLSISLLLYMKVDALVYIPIFACMFVLLGEDSIGKSVLEWLKLLRKNILNTKFLVIVLVFVVVVYPSVFFAFSNYSSDGYGYQGAGIQQSCSPTTKYITASGSINLQNFDANICSNLDFWINTYKSSYIIQPIYFTALAILGAAIMIISRKGRQLLAIGIWFLLVFLLYTAFYAGGVTYGVDWRFMLGLVAQTAILGGFALGSIFNFANAGISHFFGRYKQGMRSVAMYAIAILMIASLLYTVYGEASLLAVNPSQIQQAGNARFYENFVYNSSHIIPADCLIYTYDPTLFNLNNRSATQLSNIYDAGFVSNASAKYPCSVVDIGYWCYTPNNLCTQAENTMNLTPIATAVYPSTGSKYGFYKVG